MVSTPKITCRLRILFLVGGSMILRIVFLILFLGVSCLHLVDCWNNNDRRFLTKPLLMILLILFYLFTAEYYLVPLIAGLILSFFGDVFLMKAGDRWLLAGGCCFTGAHISYILLFLGRLDPSSFILPVIIVVPIIYGLIALFVIFKIRSSTQKAMAIGLYISLLINAAMNVLSLMHLLVYQTGSAALGYIGAILFFLSDCILFLAIYTPEKVRFHPHFLVMSTYITAQFLITMAMILA